MYYAAKISQAAGLGILLIAFLKDFPKLMNMRIFLAGALIFIFGWIIQQFMLKR